MCFSPFFCLPCFFYLLFVRSSFSFSCLSFCFAFFLPSILHVFLASFLPLRLVFFLGVVFLSFHSCTIMFFFLLFFLYSFLSSCAHFSFFFHFLKFISFSHFSFWCPFFLLFKTVALKWFKPICRHFSGRSLTLCHTIPTWATR